MLCSFIPLHAVASWNPIEAQQPIWELSAERVVGVLLNLLGVSISLTDKFWFSYKKFIPG